MREDWVLLRGWGVEKEARGSGRSVLISIWIEKERLVGY